MRITTIIVNTIGVALMAIPMVSFTYRDVPYASTVIQEDAAVIHKPPLTMSILSDSLVGFSLSPLQYCVYNYHTGHIIKRLTVDSSMLASSLRLARNISHIDLREIDRTNAAATGITQFEIRNFYRDGDTELLFYNVMALTEDSQIYEGRKVAAKNYKRLQFVAKYLPGYISPGLSYINIANNTYPSPYTGVVKAGDKLLMCNIHGNNHNMVAAIASESDSVYQISSTLIPESKNTQALCASHKMQIVTFDANRHDITICDGYNFYNQNGKLLYTYQPLTPADQVFSFKISNKSIYFYTRYKSDTVQVNHVYKYDLEKKTLKSIDEQNGQMTYGFIDDKNMLSVYKKDENYYFGLKKIKE